MGGGGGSASAGLPILPPLATDRQILGFSLFSAGPWTVGGSGGTPPSEVVAGVGAGKGTGTIHRENHQHQQQHHQQQKLVFPHFEPHDLH